MKVESIRSRGQCEQELRYRLRGGAVIDPVHPVHLNDPIENVSYLARPRGGSKGVDVAAAAEAHQENRDCVLRGSGYSEGGSQFERPLDVGSDLGA
ncbi:MAG: hypothetical protein L6Q31_00225 [Fimbriimonadaceae bacterium]|nr:hypothetical protein [Fimbriimonadaceae bacterium]NUM38378.1 hypothetical protein [Armatimonadota bacterium]